MRFAPRAALFGLLTLLLPGVVNAWWNGEWAYRKQITVDAPADLPAGTTLTDAVVLVRLHEGVLPFQDVAADGADLRFVSGDDKTPLRFHLEGFDSAFGMGYAWVQIPELQAGLQQQIWLYYGNPEAPAAGESARSYDAAQTLVWHFAENGTPAADSTAFANNGSAAFTSEPSGLIGAAARLDGQQGIALPASPSTALAAAGALSLSLWVKADAPGSDGLIYSHRDIGGSLELGLAAGLPYVEIVDSFGQVNRSQPPASAAGSEWQHLALVAASGVVRLFVDGNPVATLSAELPALSGAPMLGARVAVEGLAPVPGFRGLVDEFQLAKAARPDAVLRVAAVNQGPQDSMIGFGADEVQSSAGYMGIILGSLTVDGWVVIVLCILMMVISWYIMWIKATQVSRVQRSNAIFLELYRASHGDFIGLERDTARDAAQGKLSGRQRALLQQSPLLHLFRDGVSEMRQRLGADNHGELKGYLSPQSIQAIRATVDSRLVRENQSLGSLLVLLTIAISGGPFIGLLGTVIGVMITFAGVAAAGDVNINAIAPGISAALAATVAGLGVAIPALFGYNYLVTRNKDTMAEMLVFVDALVTRMAEKHSATAQ
jgi:biopolymer transport protein ExbB